MKSSRIVTDYILRIKRELYGIDTKTARSVVEELESHIDEKSRDLATERGLEGPDEGVYRDVVEELGPPGDVVVDYIRVLPRRPGLGVRSFLLMQLGVGIASIIIGVDQLVYARDISGWPLYDSAFLASMALIGVVLLFLGVVAVALVLVQLLRPRTLLHYGAGSAMLSLGLAAGLLLIMSQAIVWRHSETGMTDEALYGTVAPLFLLLVFAHFLGLRASDDFQRRFALEELESGTFTKGRRRSTIVMAAVMVVSLVLVAAVAVGINRYEAELSKRDELVSTEELDGVYEGRLEHWKYFYDGLWYDGYKILYKVDGVDHTGSYLPEMRTSLDWLKGNTNESTTVLCWWDYGHMVRGYSERDAVIYNPSRSLENTVADPSTIEGWEDEARVRRVAEALVATDIGETTAIMEEFSADYLLTCRRDTTGISYAFFQAAGLNILDYVTPSEGGPFEMPTELGRQTVVYRIWAGEEIPGLELVHSDIDTRIYRVPQ